MYIRTIFDTNLKWTGQSNWFCDREYWSC